MTITRNIAFQSKRKQMRKYGQRNKNPIIANLNCNQ